MKYLPLAACLMLLAASPADAFCGFYVAKADAKLYNKASKVIIAHKDNKTVVTMASDYEGDPKEFAVVVPVPVVITKEQVHLTENALVEHIDAYSAPRLVEYTDSDPCRPVMPMAMAMAGVMRKESVATESAGRSAEALGVKIEAQYTVGEYDILILSAKESGGLTTWLQLEGYRIPDGAESVLGSYLRQDMKFFVAKVNLTEKDKLGYTFLRPIQVAYESPKFMLPIRLGTVNANGPQELFIYMLTEKGRVETTNYRTVKIPSGEDVPLFVKDEFGDFYKAMFDRQVKKEDMHSVFLEYAWNMGWCDPCAADPIPHNQLRELGAFWVEADDSGYAPPSPPMPPPGYAQPMIRVMPMPGRPMPISPYRGFGGAAGVFITRLHVRYDREHFPEDLMFEETTNSENFQGRYVMHYPWTGPATCQAGYDYRRGLPDRYAKEAENLADLTGWDDDTIRDKMEKHGQSFKEDDSKPLKWYQQIWQKDQQ